MEWAVVVQNLVRDYGALRAVDGIGFEIKPGEVFGLIGPNGSGKTTTLRVIATLLKPSQGQVEVFGLDVVKKAPAVRRLVSYLPEEAGAYRNLSGIDYLRFMATFYAADTVARDKLVERAVAIADLGRRIQDKVRTYSKGMTRKLLLARTLMSNPKLAILDEPTSGLDVENAMVIRQKIKEFAARGTTILLSSHNMLEVEFLSERVALLRQGRLIALGTPEELKARWAARNLEEVFLKAD
ncbi:MAG: ABC transporter ATP-binding protein [candidate division WOR-3 bacterium]|jgi:ABC-2 type transport system ATP-binding protein|nr:ABC transporter ATP-binding protein [candidate division WOR-3 bacterium]MCR4424555.1 ABC transporter ATP-binding protein [candidate division WOR-3 bacterium]MDH7519321.1 ABC transporter ATP-binding protein [bacterium]